MANKDYVVTGDHETQVSEGGEADLHTQFIGCTKNPGHSEFIPIEKFSFSHLPEGQREKDLYEFIKATADLTVRVEVKMTSPCRPEFWPDTNVSYPFYKGVKASRIGSGMVCGVEKFTDEYCSDMYGGEKRKDYTECWCKKCQHSDTASRVWYEFYVDTATHVVFDNIEASHTSLRLFYDTVESPVVNIDQAIVDDVNIMTDRCVLKCVTCEENLGDKLDILWKHYYVLWSEVCDKHEEIRDVDKLTFIVSHPHGCVKQVSLGQWVERYRLGGLSQFTYTTCTCPGSSGAKVYCVGYGGGGWWWYRQIIHGGSLKSKLNYSGVGDVW